MRDELAKRLLVTVLDWDGVRSGQELPLLQDMAHYKYDEYQQFTPGMRFIESLARWLYQFDPEHRDAAFEFVRDKLVFCSSAEIEHLVGMAWQDRIRPHLLRAAASELDMNPRYVSQIASSIEFQKRKRQCLFLGLSDGARIDMFRRANNFDLSHEQISQTHELPDDRVAKLLDKLQSDLKRIDGNSPDNAKFRTIVLLDDFSASGRSYYMPEGENISGKISRLHDVLSHDKSGLSRLVDLNRTCVHIVLYVATESAQNHLKEFSTIVWGESVQSVTVDVVQLLPESICLKRDADDPFAEIIDAYYDHSIFDEHFEKGNSDDARLGFADGGLPLVMHHNTPNNSISLLWSYADTKVHGLFPRVRRHKSVRQ